MFTLSNFSGKNTTYFLGTQCLFFRRIFRARATTRRDGRLDDDDDERRTGFLRVFLRLIRCSASREFFSRHKRRRRRRSRPSL